MAPTFDDIVASLVAEHRRQVDDLKVEIERLREQVTDSHRVTFNPQSDRCLIELPVSCADLGQDSSSPSSGPYPGGYPQVKVGAVKSLSQKIVQESDGSGVNTGTSTKILQRLFPALGLEALVKRRKTKDIHYTYSHLSRLRAIMESGTFEWSVLFLIMLNTVVMVLEIQYDGHNRGHSWEIAGFGQSAEAAIPRAEKIFKVLDRSFVVLFTLELLARAFAYRLVFFCRFSHWLDLLIVITGWLDWLAGSHFDPKMVRLFRITKVARVMRSFNNRGFLDNLYILTVSMLASLNTLVWTLVLLTIINCIAALSLCQLLYGYFEDVAASPGAVDVFVYYGTFSRCMFTMFEVLLGNWVAPGRVLLDNVGEEYAYLLLVFKCVCGFAVINIISAVLLQQTMKILSQDTDIMLLERGRAEKQFKDHLVRLFKLLDTTQDGLISKNECEKQLDTAEVRQECFNMGLSINDLEDILYMVNMDPDAKMPIHEFIRAAQAVRKQANTMDVARVLMHARHLSTLMICVQHQVEQTSERLDYLISRLPEQLVAL